MLVSEGGLRLLLMSTSRAVLIYCQQERIHRNRR